METRVVTSHLPPDFAGNLEPRAARRRLTLEALADVNAGRTYAHADIEAWAGTLEQVGAYTKSERIKWAKVIRDSGAKPE